MDAFFGGFLYRGECVRCYVHLETLAQSQMHFLQHLDYI